MEFTTILFIYPTPFNPMVGGVERVTDLLSMELIRRGYKVLYLHHVYKETLMGYDYPAPIYFFPQSDYHSHENVTFYHNFLSEHNVDIVINQCGLFEDSVLYLNIGDNRCKKISVLHNTPLLNYEHLSSQELVLREQSFMGLLKLIARFFLFSLTKSRYLASGRKHYKFLFPNSDKVCLLSDTHIRDFERYYRDFDMKKIVSIPNPCSFVPQKCEKKKQLLYVGRLTSGQKRSDRLIKIWKKLYKKFPDWEMIIVGDGKERERLEKQAKKIERISFVGFQPPEQYYRSASIFCMTSNLEGFPMVLPEAMAFGTIPFAFESFPALRDIIDDGTNGVIIRPFSINEYVYKLSQLMGNEQQRNIMANNCMKSVARFSIDRITSQWESLFNSLFC